MIATGRIFEVRKLTDEARAEGKRVGFVPTMGALHEGHRSLIRRARSETDYVVVSIFVNPTQFGPSEDLDAYPRTLAEDLEACKAEGADLVFRPDAEEMYGPAETTSVVVGGLTARMEGAQRPGHFDGVTLVCNKLFNIVGACTAFFGSKDAQQLRVVKQMAADLHMPVEVVACPTVRDADGLALSSRNAYLKPDDRDRALSLSAALRKIEEAASSGERDVTVLLERGRAVLQAASPDAIDYLEIVDPGTLEAIDRVVGEALVCGAIRLGGTRLLDNLAIKGES